jgi:alpha-tubulin suppressor-like RCC1 family protein
MRWRNLLRAAAVFGLVACGGLACLRAECMPTDTTCGGASLLFVASSALAGASVGGPDVFAGAGHTCILTASGAVRCWGNALNGALGYGTLNAIGDDEAPASAGDAVLGGAATQLSAGGFISCARLTTGGLRCWGDGLYGQNGYMLPNFLDNDAGDNETPASLGDVVVGGPVRAVSAGAIHVCALLDTGNVRCWGENSAGQLGYLHTNHIGDNETPASAGDITLGGTAKQITVGQYFTCALMDSNNVRCWGIGTEGQLGYANVNTVGDNETPSSVGDVNVGGLVQQVAAGKTHTCALLTTGAVRCWGTGAAGQLGYGNTTVIGDNEAPAAAGDVNVGGIVTQIAAGYDHTCALLNTGAVRCWGLNTSGQLGYGNMTNIGDTETPASAGDVPVGGVVRQISAGESHTCASMADGGGLRCWGGNDSGRLGYGNTIIIGDNETPASAGDVLYR